jgi:hypothetical protein
VKRTGSSYVHGTFASAKRRCCRLYPAEQDLLANISDVSRWFPRSELMEHTPNPVDTASFDDVDWRLPAEAVVAGFEPDTKDNGVSTKKNLRFADEPS